MRESHLIPRYLHVSYGNYTDAVFAAAQPLTTASGLITDGDIEEGVVIIGFMLMNWGFSIGISWSGQLG